MKKIYTLVLPLILLFATSCSQESNRGILIQEDGYQIKIANLDQRTIHVAVYPMDEPRKSESLVVDAQRTENIQFAEASTLETSLLKVEYHSDTKTISFRDKKTQKVILNEKARTFAKIEFLGEKGYSTSQTFQLTEDEAIYGLGQYQEGILNFRGHTVNLVHANREIANPVIVSTNNYVLFWDNYSKTTFTDNAEGATFASEMGEGIDYYFVYGNDMKNAMAGFQKLTGETPMLPKTAFGFWMSKERYRSFDELTAVVEEYRKRKIPLDNIIQDWQYWGVDKKRWNAMEFDTIGFNHPKERIDNLHKMNVKVALSVWPGVGSDTKIYQSMDSIGALFQERTWAGYKVIDIYNPKAQDLYWHYLKTGLYSQGIDSWWMDATEPSFRDGLYQSKQEEWSKSAGMTHLGPFHKYLNSYSLVLSKLMYENLRKESNKRVSVLTRSAFAGQQRYSTITWSGDIYASWNVYRKQISAGLNLCMAGIPYWTTDIGGFRVINQEKAGAGAGELSGYVDESIDASDGGYTKGLEDPAYLELYTRWFQYGVFNPIFRAHGTEVPREIWHFGEPGTPFYDAQLKMIDLRYSLLSYIYSTAWQVTKEGVPMMRPMAVDFTADKQTHNDDSSYMFGDALLVHPVTDPMFYDRGGKITSTDTNISIYLPKHEGKVWYDLNSDRAFEAGEKITYSADLDIIPVFVKGGSILPKNKIVEYVSADNGAEMDIVIYSGADAKFTLYEDDNETYNYEKGEYSTIEMTWDDATKVLSISSPKGKLTPLNAQRTFNIKLMTAKDSLVQKEEKTVTYKNKQEVINF